MTLQGTIRGGMVVLDQPVEVPDGTTVSVYVPTLNRPNLTVEQVVARQKRALAELLALPNENPGDTFNGEGHDRILYGEQDVA